MLRLVTPAIVFLAVAAVGPCNSGPAHPMATTPWGVYRIEVSVAGAEFVGREIGEEGHGCEVFAQIENADRTCRIAILLIPNSIGGEA